MKTTRIQRQLIREEFAAVIEDTVEREMERGFWSTLSSNDVFLFEELDGNAYEQGLRDYERLRPSIEKRVQKAYEPLIRHHQSRLGTARKPGTEKTNC